MSSRYIHIPVGISLAEKTNGRWNIYSITRNGNLSWNITESDEDIEDDDYTIIVSSSIIQRLFSSSIKIYQNGQNVFAVNPDFSLIYLRQSAQTSVYV